MNCIPFPEISLDIGCNVAVCTCHAINSFGLTLAVIIKLRVLQPWQYCASNEVYEVRTLFVLMHSHDHFEYDLIYPCSEIA